VWLLAVNACCIAVAAPPRVTNDRYQLELVATEPEIVTPVGMTFDRAGRLLVIESHTHQTPEKYEGPKHDRIRMLSDSDGDAKLDRWSTFAEGFRHAMNLLARKDGAVYVVERGRVLLLTDTDDNGVADKQDVLLRLETEDDYPHNALGGIDETPDGLLIIGLGENHGLPFKLIGSDGKTISATGGLDGFFRCTVDGKNIEHIARGVWNPFSLCVVPDGRIFAVDNDPDASPPCRLLHVVEGGDYGYLYQYGRAGTHPLQSWNGELPGTLPMVCGTGEAPTAIVDHAGSLWVTSWGDYRIERYRLVPRGASYTATRDVVVQGDADFRPAGMAVAPDGSLYFGDWVLRDYPVHCRGRIWRLTLPRAEITVPFPPQSELDKWAAGLARDTTILALASDDPFVRAAGIWRLAEKGVIDPQSETAARMFSDSRVLLSALIASRLAGSDRAESLLRQCLNDESQEVRLYAVRWIADERITALRDEVAKLLESPPPSRRYYLAVLAAVDWLDNKPEMRSKEIADELLVRELKRDDRSPEALAMALSLVSPDNKFLTLDRLREYLQDDYLPLRLEAMRSLALQTNPERFEILAAAASDESQSDELRAEAVAGLFPVAEKQRNLLEQLAEVQNAVLRREAQRVLRLAQLRPAPTETRPSADDLDSWNTLLQEPGDAMAGRRLFFSEVGPRCGICHQHSGRGGHIAPDLTHIARSNSRERIITSILKPDQEVAPQYQPWLLVTDDGKTHTGLRMPEGGDDGTEEYIDLAGNHFRLPSNTIEIREATSTSIMPSGLESTVSIDDLRDIVTFLTNSNGGT
jgi:putative membrane-bound dehydrogenase-like protein